MPTYDFKCPKCSFEKSVTRSIKDDAPVPCKYAGECGGVSMTQLLPTNTTFQLKGPGWAKDGY